MSSATALDDDSGILGVDSKVLASLPKNSIYFQQQHYEHDAHDIHDEVDGDQSLEKRMSGLMLNRAIHDVTFEIGENKLHYTTLRSIIASASPVFYKMFYSSNMAESSDKSNKLIVKIPDIHELGFEMILYYAFIGQKCLDKIASGNILHVLKAADKYHVNGLTKLCHHFFNQSINVNNVISLLIVGYQLAPHGTKQFRNRRENSIYYKSEDLLGGGSNNERKDNNNNESDSDEDDVKTGAGISGTAHLYDECYDFLTSKVTQYDFEHKIFNMKKNKDFVYLPFDVLCDLIRNDRVCCREELIWNACLEWYRYNSNANNKENVNDNGGLDSISTTNQTDNNDDEKKSASNQDGNQDIIDSIAKAGNGRRIVDSNTMKELVKHIRFALMSAEYLYTNIENCGWLTNDEMFSIYRRMAVDLSKIKSKKSKNKNVSTANDNNNNNNNNNNNISGVDSPAIVEIPCAFNCNPRKPAIEQGWNSETLSHPSIHTFSGDDNRIATHSSSGAHSHIYGKQSFTSGEHEFIVTINNEPCCGFIGLAYIDQLNENGNETRYDHTTWAGRHYLGMNNSSDCVFDMGKTQGTSARVVLNMTEGWMLFESLDSNGVLRNNMSKRVLCEFRDGVAVVPVLDSDENGVFELEIIR